VYGNRQGELNMVYGIMLVITRHYHAYLWQTWEDCQRYVFYSWILASNYQLIDNLYPLLSPYKLAQNATFGKTPSFAKGKAGFFFLPLFKYF
jgi:hypothetical protein